MTEDMASVVINERTQVMLLSSPTFAGHAQHRVLDAAAATEVILGLAQPSAAEVDALADRAVAAGARWSVNRSSWTAATSADSPTPTVTSGSGCA